MCETLTSPDIEGVDRRLSHAVPDTDANGLPAVLTESDCRTGSIETRSDRKFVVGTACSCRQGQGDVAKTMLVPGLGRRRRPCTCWLASRLSFRDFAKAIGQLEKTDRIDARVLAAFDAFAELPLTQPRGGFLERLGDMLVVREQFVDQRMALKATLSEADDPMSGKVVPGVIARLDKAIARYDRQIKQPISGKATHAESYRILNSIPGIGPVTAAALICWMSELGTIGNHQEAALIGVAPMARDSGTVKGARRINCSRPRDLLYMAGKSAMDWNLHMKAIYDRLREWGKNHKIALVAVMRHLIVLAKALLRDRRIRTEQAPA